MLPAILLVVGLLVQPVTLAYSSMVMESTAAEMVRVLTSRRGDMDDDQVLAYGRRRLKAIPEVPLFHSGGEDDWEVRCEGAEGDGHAQVTIRGHCQPLPVLGILPALMGSMDDKGLVLEVTVGEQVRPSWLGGGYGDWTSIWS